jgi:hypothetical protein
MNQGVPSNRALPRAMLCLAMGAIALLVSASARADELKLKDGTKITGTIVGFEENSFKVKTSYGFAEVMKAQVVSITISDTAKKPDAKEKAAPAAEKSSETAKSAKASETAANAPAPAEKSGDPVATPSAPSNAAPSRPAAPAPKPMSQSPATTANAAAPASNSAAPVAGSNTVPAPAVAAEPPAPAAPEPVREEVTGNLYTNDTYGFRMYKPPDWQVIAGARSMLPGAITAMGTDDQRTYLLIGQEPTGKSMATDIDAAEKRLRDIMENFRPLGESHIAVSGVSAVEHRFRGTVDQHDWSGVAVFVPHGSQLYTIFGMTLADTDLVQIQENVIARAISSLQFTRQ